MKKNDLNDVIDLHVHTAPDVQPRLMDDVEIAHEAAEAGMRAVLLKSHHTLTADRAAIASKQVEGIQVFGGLVLNQAVGGLNPCAVEVALAMGAKEIWMPTLSAANHLRASNVDGEGITILDESGAIKPVVNDILRLIAPADVILGTGHLSVEEIIILVKAARGVGVKSILVTHPELPVVNMPLEIQKELCGPGVYFERCLYTVVTKGTDVSMATIAKAVVELGAELNVLATDFGQVVYPSPVEGMRSLISGMLEVGVSEENLDLMTRVIPARLLGLA